MKKCWIPGIILAAFMLILFFLVPFIAARFIPSEAGMPVSLLLFFVLNPLLGIYTGILAGADLAVRWWLPLLYDALLSLGYYLTLKITPAELLPWLILYAAVIILTMLITAFVSSRK